MFQKKSVMMIGALSVLILLLIISALYPGCSRADEPPIQVVPISPDNTTLAIDHPRNASTLNGTVEINGVAYGTNITSVEVRIDEGSWQQAAILNGSPPPVPGAHRLNFDYSYTWDTTKVSDGSHLIYVRASGESGTNETTITVTVANGEYLNIGSSASQFDLVIVMAATTAVSVAILTFVAIYSRRR
ncbi:MAG: Ig-like domain-containing protein [Candidatus Thermoplasmatota archaeon]